MSRAFALPNQTAVQDYRDAEAAVAEWREQLLLESTEMGLEPVVFLNYTRAREVLCGFRVPADESRIPAGWRKVIARNLVEPMRGPAGREARDWLDAHRSPDSGMTTLVNKYRLPPVSRSLGDDGRIWISPVQVFDVDNGVLYALHRHDGLASDIGDWTEVPMSEFCLVMEGAGIRTPV